VRRYKFKVKFSDKRMGVQLEVAVTLRFGTAESQDESLRGAIHNASTCACA
jgi:hypothetical protein